MFFFKGAYSYVVPHQLLLSEACKCRRLQLSFLLVLIKCFECTFETRSSGRFMCSWGSRRLPRSSSSCRLQRVYFCLVNVVALAGGTYCCFIGEWRHAWVVKGGAALINECRTFERQLIRTAYLNFVNSLSWCISRSCVTQLNPSRTLPRHKGISSIMSQ